MSYVLWGICRVRGDVTRCPVCPTYCGEYVVYAVMSRDVQSVLRTVGGRYLYHVLRGTLYDM